MDFVYNEHYVNYRPSLIFTQDVDSGINLSGKTWLKITLLFRYFIFNTTFSVRNLFQWIIFILYQLPNNVLYFNQVVFNKGCMLLSADGSKDVIIKLSFNIRYIIFLNCTSFIIFWWHRKYSLPITVINFGENYSFNLHVRLIILTTWCWID